MPFIPIDVPPGVVKRATPLQSSGRYWDANLVRWQSGKLLPVGGWTRITSSSLGATPKAIFSWNTNAGLSLTIIGCDNNLFSLEGSAYTDITPDNYIGPEDNVEGAYGSYDYGVLLYGDDTNVTYPRPPSEEFQLPFSWSIDNWGEDALAVSSSDGRLLHYAEGDTKTHPVGAANILTAVRVTNVVTVTTGYHHDFLAGDSVAISGVSVANMNGLFTVVTTPSLTSFTYASAAADASGTGGTASPAVPVPTNNRGVIVTPERYAVLYGAGGNARRVSWSNQEDYTNWDFASAVTTAGFLDLDTTDAIIMAAPVREGTLIWTNNEAWIMRYIGLPFVYSIERIGSGCGLMAPRSFATTAGRCIWMGREGFWIYDGGVVKPLSCDVGSYVFGDIDSNVGTLYSHGSDNGVFPEVWFWYPSSGSTSTNKYVIYNYAEGWWSVGAMERSAASPSGVYPYPIMGNAAGNLFFHEDGWTDAGDPIETDRYAETASITLSGGNVISNITQGMVDNGYGYASTQLTFLSTFAPQGAETTYGPYNSRSDGYMDIRASGRDFRVKISSTQDAEWSIGQIRLDVTTGGRR